MLAEITLTGTEIGAIVTAVGTLIAIMSAQLIKQRTSRVTLNLKEDEHLYKRLREQSAKQDRRLGELEKRVDDYGAALRESEKHRVACETELAYLKQEVARLSALHAK